MGNKKGSLAVSAVEKKATKKSKITDRGGTEDSVRQLVLDREKPGHLKEMRGLFEQADNSESRLPEELEVSDSELL